jgi:quercetin dioxygenase-like cupin family protein
MDIRAIDWNQTPWEQVREGVERKAFSGDGATVSLNRLRPGHEPRPHAHPHEQIVYILEGEIDFHIGDTVTRLGPGGLLVVPPNARHWGEVVGDAPVLNLDIFTPKRSEYAA